MSLRAAFVRLLNKYPIAQRQPFAGNPVAKFIREGIPAEVEKIIGPDDRYLVEGAPGKGNWAAIPWIAVFDRLITESAQHGFYVVYLPREDFSGIYLTLMQGVTTVSVQYGAKAHEALAVRAADFGARLGPIGSRWTKGAIDLRSVGHSKFSELYEQGTICSTFYPSTEIPPDDMLTADLVEALRYYLLLASKQTLDAPDVAKEADEVDVHDENLTRLREHKRIERNRKLAERAKRIHGYRCQACGFDFRRTYGELGVGFIEAHHLTPLAFLKGRKVSLNPRIDFAVLCANCHRMIHRSDCVDRVDEFRRRYLHLP